MSTSVVMDTLSAAASATSMDAAASSSALSSLLASASDALASASAASSSAAEVIATATGGSSSASTKHPASYRIVGIVLAVISGLFIGSSFVFKKKGLLSMQNKPGFVAGEGHAYLKSPMWWTGMTLMVIGEICNFVAYAFTEAILVTPLGALSVVICAILSSIFLKEKLTFFGKIGCGLCILGATIIALNGPASTAVATIPQFQKLFLSPGFLAFGSIVIVLSAGLIFFVAPRYGKKNMLVYITVCSLIGGLSVSCTSGLGSSILTSINGNNQFKHWFMYFLMVFVVCTLLLEINYLNKALELFNTALVTPTYYVLFTFATLVTDVILNQGFDASVTDIITVVFGFLVICCGITLLQMSKIDPVDLAQKVSLDRRTTLLLSAANKAEHAHDEQSGDSEADEKRANLDLEDPGVDSVRGFVGLAGSVHRAISARKSIASRRKSRLSQAHGHGHEGEAGVDENGLMVVDGRWRHGGRRPRHGRELSTAGEDGFTRHQLYDAPMPLDAAERISHYSHSTAGGNGGLPPTPTSATSSTDRHAPHAHVGFEEEVIEHRYPARGETGEVVHQQHYPPVYGTSRRDTTNSSILDAYSSRTPTNATFPSSALSTPKPQPAARPFLNHTFPTRSGSRASASSAGSGSSSATGGSVQRAGTRSLSQMITDHFAASTPDLRITIDAPPGHEQDQSGRDVDEYGQERRRQGTAGSKSKSRGASKSRSPTARSFFSSITGHGSHSTHRDHDRNGAEDDEELVARYGEERMGLVDRGAEMGSRRDISNDSADTTGVSGRDYGEKDGESSDGEVESIHEKPTRRL